MYVKSVNDYLVCIEYDESGTWGYMYDNNGKLIQGGRLTDKLVDEEEAYKILFKPLTNN